MKTVKVKLSTHMENGLMCRVYLNQGQRPICLGVTWLERFYNLPLMKKISSHLSQELKGNKVETWYTHGQWVDVLRIPKSGPRAHNVFS